MFGLSKLLGFFALPSNLLFALALLGILLMVTRFRRLGQGLARLVRYSGLWCSASRRSATY